MRTLPKHLRPRWRYLGVEIETWPGADIDRRGFQGALWEAARGLLGDPGSAACDLTVTRFRFDAERGMGNAIVRVRREEVSRGRAALACVSDVDGSPTGLVVRTTSGTIRACEERLRNRSDPESGTQSNAAETTVRFPFANGTPDDGSPSDRPVTDRPAVEKCGGRLDVHADEAGESFVGATALDAESESEGEGEDCSTESDPTGS